MSDTKHEPLVQDAIVVGVDGSRSSQEALRWAAYLAVKLGAPIHAVAAWAPVAEWVPTVLGGNTLPVDWRPQEIAEGILADTVREIIGDAAVQVTQSAIPGGAARVLLEQSEGARMLVVGSRGHGGFAGLLLGSVSGAVAEHAKCPVLVVHGQAAPPPE